MNRIRVERCRTEENTYAPGWIVLWGEGVRDNCLHETHGDAIECVDLRLVLRRNFGDLVGSFSGPLIPMLDEPR
jgi:hypothetical protein